MLWQNFNLRCPKRSKTMIVLISLLVMVMMTSLRRSLLLPQLTTIVGVETPLLHYHQPSLLLKVNLINLVVTEIRVRWQIQFFIFPFKILTNQLCCWRRRSCVGVTTFLVGRETLLGCWREQSPGAFCCTFGSKMTGSLIRIPSWKLVIWLHCMAEHCTAVSVGQPEIFNHSRSKVVFSTNWGFLFLKDMTRCMVI